VTESDPLLSVKEVTERLRVTHSTVRRWIREGKMAAIHVGPTHRVRIRLSELLRHVRELPANY